MKHMCSLIALLVIVLVLVGCGLSGGGNETSPTIESTQESGEQVQSPTDAPTEAQGEPFLNVPGVGSIHLFTDVQGGGEKPLFAWESVSGADRYQLFVFDEAGEPYWAWEGTQTQVYLGGSDSQPPADSSGAAVGAGYHWAVVVYDSNGQVLASSELRSISP